MPWKRQPLLPARQTARRAAGPMGATGSDQQDLVEKMDPQGKQAGGRGEDGLAGQSSAGGRVDTCRIGGRRMAEGLRVPRNRPHSQRAHKHATRAPAILVPGVGRLTQVLAVKTATRPFVRVAMPSLEILDGHMAARVLASVRMMPAATQHAMR